MPQTVLLGFRSNIEEGPDIVSWPMSYDSPLPDAALVALLLDATNIDPELTNLRRVDITKALDRGASLIVVVGPGAQAAASSSLGNWLSNLILSPLGLSLSWGGPIDLASEQRELTPFFRDQMAHAHVGVTLPPSTTALARARPGGPDSPVVSLQFEYGQAPVFLVPLRSAQSSEDEVLRFIGLMPSHDEYPQYLDALDLGGEQEARVALQELHEREAGLQAQLAAAHRAKRILYSTGMALQQEVVRFFGEELGVPATLVEGNHEDFHLVRDGPDGFWCIGEVKGREAANVKKTDVNALTIHRSDAGLDDAFPSLLVVNTFQKKTSMKERDEPLHPDVVRRAAEDHVVVVRTLDLVRIKKGLGGDGRPLEDLLSTIGAGGGWFEVDDAGTYGLRLPQE